LLEGLNVMDSAKKQHTFSVKIKGHIIEHNGVR